MGCRCGRSVDGGGGGGRQDRREGDTSHGDGKCDPTSGAGTAAHRLSFLARGGHLATEVPKAFPERLTGLRPEIKPFRRKLRRNKPIGVSKRSGTCFNDLAMTQIAPQRLTIRQIADLAGVS